MSMPTSACFWTTSSTARGRLLRSDGRGVVPACETRMRLVLLRIRMPRLHDCRRAAVHVDRHAGDVGASSRAQEGDQVADLFCLAHPTERDAHAFGGLGVVLVQRAGPTHAFPPAPILAALGRASC